MKTIVVSGDLVYDYNLVQHPKPPGHHRTELPSMLVHEQLGGAWFLEELIRIACEDLIEPARGRKKARLLGVDRGGRSRGVNVQVGQAYQIWSRFQREIGSKKKGETWRISRFLGCQRASEGRAIRVRSNRLKRPDVVVLDDLCLGFRENRRQWPEAIKDGGDPVSIILKTSSPDFRSPLWKQLIKNFANRLTVVLSVSSLRDRGAELCRALSWDCTIEEMVREFQVGASSRDLARCRRVIVHFASSGVGSFARCETVVGKRRSEELIDGKARLERFLYDPGHCEGTWKTRYPGRVFGDLSLLTASIVRHEVRPEDYPIVIALGRALCAMRKNQELGVDIDNELSGKKALSAIKSVFHASDGKEPSEVFATAYPRLLNGFDYGVVLGQGEAGNKSVESNLLRDLMGDGLEYAAAKALEVVIRGPKKALKSAPSATYGKYLTVDRQEIERINAISNLIHTYKSNPKDTKPLCIAVFGPPGSGKSFAIKQLFSGIFEDQKALEFNLSQFRLDEGDLFEAFHQVRDISIKGKIPLVFWDEFDVDDMRWLKEFLVPMQDAKFMAKGAVHPLGRAIFVFAGGVHHSFYEFQGHHLGGDEYKAFLKGFKGKKGPDFISRLQGYVNIKGLQPARPHGKVAEKEWKELTYEQRAKFDPAHLIRRAIILRASLQTSWPGLIDPDTKIASVSAAVIQAFLRTSEYRHGARSLNSLVRMSRLADVERFTASAFPSVEILSMLVSGDFIDRLREGHFDLPVTEVLAKACHEAWKKKREEDGWTYGEVRDDANKKNPRLVQYDKLSLEWKEDNRKTARLTYGKLRDVGLKIVPDTILGSGRSRSKVITSKVQKRLMEIEHEIWLRDHFIRGYQWDKKTIEPLRLHRDMAEFKDVPRTDRELDRAISETIEGTLRSNGYALVEIAAPGPETPTGTKGTERGRQRKRSPGRAPAKKSAKRKKK